MEEKTKFEKLWGQAHNLCSAYDNLRQMRELFASAVEAEKSTSLLSSRKQTLADEIKALGEAKELLTLRYKEEVDRIKEQKVKAESEIVRMKEMSVKRFESEHGKMVEEAEVKLVSISEESTELKSSIESKLSYIRELDKKIQVKEGQIQVFEDQFQQIQKALT